MYMKGFPPGGSSLHVLDLQIPLHPIPSGGFPNLSASGTLSPQFKHGGPFSIQSSTCSGFIPSSSYQWRRAAQGVLGCTHGTLLRPFVLALTYNILPDPAHEGGIFISQRPPVPFRAGRGPSGRGQRVGGSGESIGGFLILIRARRRSEKRNGTSINRHSGPPGSWQRKKPTRSTFARL